MAMDSLLSYGSSDEEDNSNSVDESVLDSLKSKFPLNAAPAVPIRVSIN